MRALEVKNLAQRKTRRHWQRGPAEGAAGMILKGREMSYYVCKPLTLYEDEGSEFRVQRDTDFNVAVEQQTVTRWWDDHERLCEEYFHWSFLTYLDGYTDKYRRADRRGKLAANKEWAEKGRVWIEHWKVLVAGPMWVVRCLDWDGQGTVCPLLREREDGTLGCPVKFGLHGYGGRPGLLARPLPERCPSQLNSSHRRDLCLPSEKDEHGFSLRLLALARCEIWMRQETE